MSVQAPCPLRGDALIRESLPDAKVARFMCGSPVRKDPDVLAAFLGSLEAQVVPRGTALSHVLVDDNTNPDSSAILQSWCERNQGLYLDRRSADLGDFREGAFTHEWTAQAMSRVGALKNELIGLCLEQQYDGLWFVDADLVMGPRTFWSLYHTDAPIACGVFWTRWQNEPSCPALPQVWLRHPYHLDGRGLDHVEFMDSLMARQRVQVWGQGACSLYRSDVFRKGVSFARVTDLPTGGMWDGEDRHLCTRAERLHVPMYADAWPDIYHVYHEQDRTRIPVYDEPDGAPATDDLISVQLQPLEPVLNNGQAQFIGVQHVRGRLGRLKLADDLDEAIRSMSRGEQRIVSVEFPSWSPVVVYRGQRRLMQVTLLDWKAYRLPLGVR